MRTDQSHECIRVVAGPALANAEIFFDGACENLRDEMQDVADAEIDRDRIPGRADAEGVDMAVGEAVDHVGRRQHHEPDILVRIDPARRHPEPQLIIVGGKRKGHAEGQGFGADPFALRDDTRQRQGGHHRIETVARDLLHEISMQRR